MVPSYDNLTAGVLLIAEKYQISPKHIFDEWDIELYEDCIEKIHVQAEIDHRKSEAMENQ